MVGNGRVCREGGTKMRDVGGRGLAKGDDYCGGGLLICIRKTKGVGRAVYACMCACPSFRVTKDEGRPIKSLFPPSSLYRV